MGLQEHNGAGGRGLLPGWVSVKTSSCHILTTSPAAAQQGVPAVVGIAAAGRPGLWAVRGGQRTSAADLGVDLQCFGALHPIVVLAEPHTTPHRPPIDPGPAPTCTLTPRPRPRTHLHHPVHGGEVQAPCRDVGGDQDHGLGDGESRCTENTRVKVRVLVGC